MIAADVKIRRLTLEEIATLIEWAAGEGWDPGLADTRPFHAADPDGFLGLFVDGQMTAGISAVTYGADFGFIGLYICKPDMRGRGYGKAVWDAGMARLEGMTMGLDGVVAQQANYRSMGFETAYRSFRMSGRYEKAPQGGGRVGPLTTEQMDDLAAYDRRHFPGPRPEFLARWVAAPHIALASHDSQGRLQGYGVARRTREGHKVGPLFANDGDVALDLLAALTARVDSPVHLDVPESNQAFMKRLLDEGLRKGFETARMYRGPAPAIRQDGVFAITSLELG